MAGDSKEGIWWCQFKALVKRNYLIKLRYKTMTVMEFLIPIIFIMIIGAVNKAVTANKNPKSTFPVEKLSSPDTVPGILQGVLVVYPSTPNVTQVASSVCSTLNCTVMSFSDEDSAEDFYSNSSNTFMFGLAFASDDNISSYEIRFPKDANLPTGAVSSSIDQCSYQTCPPSQYLSQGLSTLQSLIDYEIIKLKDPTAQRPDILSQLMPELRYINTQDPTLRIMFPLYFVYTMAYLTMYLAAGIVDDKHKKRKDHLLMQGMRPSAYWLSWAVVNLPQALIVAVASVIILAAFSFFNSAPAYIFFFVTVLVYCLNNILVGICFSSLLNNPQAVFLVLFGTVGLGAIGLVNMYKTDYITDPSYPASDLAPIGGIICLIPPAAMLSILERMFTLGATYPGGLESSGAFLAGDLPLVVMFAILVFDIFLWIILALWLDGILPNSLGARLSCCFCINSKYWKPDPPQAGVLEKYLQSRNKANYEDNPNVEAVPRSMIGTEAVRLFNVRKHFDQGGLFSKKEPVNAVNGIDLDIYEGQITALLGHNGAGKTTLINMMTGIMPVSSGGATVYGYDAVNQIDLQSIRDMMGICPQIDVINEKLSVREHLELYARMKGIAPDEISQRVEKTMQDCDLVDQADTFGAKLSGGQKRKLNVGMALIGDPKILFLDEPTAGMDPYSRRHLWDLLKKSRAGRVVLLTTHFMDEADILADRKAIISKGKLQCAGSSLYLKNKFGIGYQLSLVVEDPSKQDEITSTITQAVEGSSHQRTFGKEVNYSLPFDQSNNFASLFETLDTRKDELTVSSYSISMTTLEEVFLKLGEDAEMEGKKNGDHESNGHLADDTIQLNMMEQEIENPVELKPVEGYNTDGERIKYMIKQVFRMIVRVKPMLVVVFFVIAFLIAGLVMMLTSQPKVQAPEEPKPISLSLPESIRDGNSAYQSDRIIYFNNTNGDIDSLVTNMGSQLPSDMYMSAYDGSYDKTMVSSAFGYDVNQFTTITASFNLTIRYNHTYQMSLPVAVNMLGTAMYKIAANDPQAEILTSVKQWPVSERPSFQPSASAFSGLFFVLALFTAAATFGVVIVGDREKGRRTMLRVASVSVNSYFGTYFVVTISLLIPLLLIGGIAIIAAQVNSFKSPVAAVLLLIHMVIQACNAPLISFAWTYAFEREQSAGNIGSINNLFAILFFLPVAIMFIIPSTIDTASIVHHFLCILIPYYSYPGGFLAFDNVYRKYTISQLVSGASTIDEIPPAIDYFKPENGVLSALLGGLLWIGLSILFIRIGEVRLSGGKLSDVCSCKSNAISMYDPNAVNTDRLPDEDEDVKEERQTVEAMWNDPSEDTVMMANDLRKTFPKRKQKQPKVAVRNVSFHVTNGEVFGLLGPNGAGKSTVINMVIAEHAPSAGKIAVDKIEVHSALTDAYKIIGFCPQADALWPYGTVYEILVFYGISAGLTANQAELVSNYYLKMMKIEEHRDKITEHLSGGTRRKVSLAVSLMGWPRLVLLDEPSTGLDPSSKRFLWDTIRASFSGYSRAAILTTHYMEEADALCNRIGIMVNGAIECLGTSSHLKTKYGDGFQLEIKLKDTGNSEEALNKLKSFITEQYPRTAILESFSDRILYAMPTDSISSPAQVFGPIEQNKDELMIEEYSFSQTTLEQVFLQFAKQQLDADEDEANAEKNRKKARELLRQKSTLSTSGDNPTERTHL